MKKSSSSNQPRKAWLSFRLNEEEQQLLNERFKNSGCRQLSDYIRRMVLQKPVNVKFRNASVDDFLTDMLQLKKELNQIGNNFNQAVHQLYTLERLGDFEHWILTNEQDKARLFGQIEIILSRVEKLYALWSQK
ncbi:MAG: plasmid mobilization relaxosome protein MobC [Puia sp.]|nr:plasmid mobilization relaxosome protein MobC [Puia sp.]